MGPPTAPDRLGAIDRSLKRVEKILRALLGTVEGLRLMIEHETGTQLSQYKEYEADDEDEVSSITDIEEVRRKARRQRTTNRKIKTWGKAIAPLLLLVGGVLWEGFQRIVLGK